MAIKNYRPTSAARRHMQTLDFSDLSKKEPEKLLLAKSYRASGRNNYGRQTSVNSGGGHKRRYRLIDFTRLKRGIPATVIALEYDPNRTARLALLSYKDGEKAYILAPNGLTVGQTIMAGEKADITPGNALPLRVIPEGQMVHNLEIKPGCGAQMVRSAGTAAQVLGKEGDYCQLRLPSGEMRLVHLNCYATIGQVGNLDHSNMIVGKAGRSRWLGIRPHTRGIAKNPVDHAMGGRTNGGRHPCSALGLKAKGLKTRANKRTDKFILRRKRASAA